MNDVICPSVCSNHTYSEHGCPDIHLRRRYGYVDSHSHLDACILENGFRWSQFSFPDKFLGTVLNFAFPKHHHSFPNILVRKCVWDCVCTPQIFILMGH